MTKPFRVVIPARYESSRLQGKVLLPVAGRPMVEHVWQRAIQSGAEAVVIATDSDVVARAAEAFGAEVCITSKDCQSGTDRVAEACDRLGWSDALPVVNVQGDAPMIPPASIAAVAALLNEHSHAAIATLCTGIESVADYTDPNVVKVIFDQTGRALYFSRSPIPAAGHGTVMAAAAKLSYRHIGLYAYRYAALQTLTKEQSCDLEGCERLEQLRALWLGMEIRIAIDDQGHGPDVDTAADLARVTAMLNKQPD